MTINPRIKPIERATNRCWDEWLEFMDSIDAKNLDHHEIAHKVSYELEETVENAGWWAQAITVAYEQHIGRRLPGQRSDGTFETSVSKSTQLAMQDLMDAWVIFAAKDQDVLSVIAGDPKIGGTDKRITWRTKAMDRSSIMVTSEPKSNGTASIIATQTGLLTQDLNNDAKTSWSLILARFLESL